MGKHNDDHDDGDGDGQGDGDDDDDDDDRDDKDDDEEDEDDDEEEEEGEEGEEDDDDDDGGDDSDGDDGNDGDDDYDDDDLCTELEFQWMVRQHMDADSTREPGSHEPGIQPHPSKASKLGYVTCQQTSPKPQFRLAGNGGQCDAAEAEIA